MLPLLQEVQIQKYEDDVAAGAVNYRAKCEQPLREVEEFLIRVLSAAKNSGSRSGSSSPSSRSWSSGGGFESLGSGAAGEGGSRVEEVGMSERRALRSGGGEDGCAEAMDED